MSGFAIVYIISNLFCTMDVYLLFDSFLGQIRKKSMISVYMLYFTVVTGEYLLLGIPVITLFLNIAGFLGLSLCYKATWKLRIACVLFCYALYILAEAIVMGVSGYFVYSYISRVEYKSYVGMACLPLVFFVILMVVRYFRRERGKEAPVPVVYWIVVLLVPLSSVTVTMVIHTIPEIRLWQIILVESIMFVITVGVYYLYVKQMAYYENEKMHVVAERQLEAYKKQVEAIHESNLRTKSLKHDMKNHLLAIGELAKESNDEKVVDYVSSMTDFLPSIGLLSTGNMAMDAIINSKVYDGKNKNIQIETDIRVIDEPALSNFEITIVLGNILDNIIENALDKACIMIRCDKGRIIIKSSNTYDNKREIYMNMDDQIMNPSEYGTGLKNVASVVEAHGGEMHIRDKKGVFTLEMIMYA